MQRRLLITSLAAGLVSITAQSLIIRELVIAFLGNELVIGVTLGAWLLWTGLGAATLGRLGERSPSPTRWLAAELMALALLLPACFLATAFVRTFAGLDPGEVAGPIPAILSCTAILCLPCIFNGAIFPTLCRAISETLPRQTAIARVYVWEAVGSAAGGVLFSAAIIRMQEPSFAVLACSLVLAALAGPLAVGKRARLTLAATALATLVLVFIASDWMTVARVRSRGALAVGRINTIYGRTQIEERNETTSVFDNGILSATYPLVGAAEPLVHLTLLQVDHPRNVLLIGGLGGTAEEALKYPGAHVDIVELDPDSVEFVRRFKPPSSLDAALETGRARLLFEDGRRYVAHYHPPPRDHVLLDLKPPYDAIILDLPKPLTAQINRYYTVEFFRAAARILSTQGVLAFSVESAPNLSTPELREFIACLERTLRAAFADDAVAPGDFNTFLACREPGRLTLDPDLLLDRLASRKIATKSFDATVQADLNPFKVDELRSILAESTSARINTDLHPLSYSHGLVVWTAEARTPRSGALDKLIDAPLRWLARFASWPAAWRWGGGMLVLAACVALVLLLRLRRSAAAGLAVACGGFTEIAIEVAALLAFQALYGYVYAMLGLVLASFMVGLCLGGQAASRIVRRGAGEFRPLLAAQHLFADSEFRPLLAAQYVLAAYPLILVGVIWGASRAGLTGWPVAAAFLLLTFIAGFIGGLQFPLAAAVAGSSGPSVAGSASHGVAAKLSALDLCGAAVGAVTVSTLLIPALGFVTLGVVLSGLGLVPLAALCSARHR